MKTLIVGDIHGDWGKLNTLVQKKRPDKILQCGDFGWWPKMEMIKPVIYHRQKSWVLRGVKTQGAELYFCDGNHEEHPDLIQDGRLHTKYEGVIHASRGSIGKLPDGKAVLFIGGASSTDQDQRTEGIDWFAAEDIQQREFDKAMSHEYKIDVVISHTCPKSFDMSSKSAGKETDYNRYLLDQILHKYKPARWFFGHWHQHKEGTYKGTRWTCLDYPGHGSRWWTWLDK